MAVRPSKEELLKNVLPEQLDQPCEDGDLIKLSHSITDWEYIACLLGLTNPEIQAIKTNSNSEECRRIMMLRAWNGKCNFKATYRSLIDVFYTYELTDLVTKVCDIIDIQQSNTSGRSVINPNEPAPRQQTPPHSLKGSQRKRKRYHDQPSPTLDNSLQMSGQQMPSHVSSSTPPSSLPFPDPNLPLPSGHAGSSLLSFSLPIPAPDHYSPTALVSSHHYGPGTPASFRQPYRLPFQMHSAAFDSSLAVYSRQRCRVEFGLIPHSSHPYPAPSLPLPSEHTAAASPHDCSSACTSGSVSQSVPHQTHSHSPMAQTAASPNSFTLERYCHPGEIRRFTYPPHHSYHTQDTRTFPPSPYHGQKFHQMPFHPTPPCKTGFPQQRHQTAIRPPISQGLSMTSDQPTTTTDQSTHSCADSREYFTLQLPPSLLHHHHTFPGAEALHIPPYKMPVPSHSSTHNPVADHLQLGIQTRVPNAPNIPYVPVLPLLNMSHVLQYAVYLRQRYGTHIPSFFTLTWPPPPTRKVFNLSMVQQRMFEYGAANEELARLMLQGNVRGVLNKKKEVKLEEICVLDKELRRVILIEGAPGAGKSTLAWNIVQKWRLGEMFQEFDIVIYIQLRDPTIQAAQSLADTLPARSKAMAMEVASELEVCDGSRTLFVIDSWDEYPPGLRKDSFFKTLICEPATLSMALSTLIITSRPIATGGLQQFGSTRVEIVGFTPDETKQYFTEALGDSQSVERLQERLREQPVIEASCYLPLNAAIVAHIFLVNQSLPTTLHGVFTSMVICCIIRHMKKEGIQQLPEPHKDSSLEDFVSLLPNSYQQQFLNICTLAYHGVIENKATFSNRDLQRFKLPVNFSTLSLIQATESIACYQQSAVLYNFLHLSIQELLAAFHISMMPPSEQVEIFKEMFGQLRFSAVFQFYSAFTKLQTEGIQEIVASIVKGGYVMNDDVDDDKLLSLLHCLYEAQDPSLCKFVAFELNGELFLQDTTLSPVDCLAVGYFLTKVGLATSREFKVDFMGCSLNDYKVNLLVKGLSQCHRIRELQQATDTETSGSLDMILSVNRIQYEGTHSIANLLSSSNMISKLDLAYNEIQEGGDGLVDLCKALMTNTSLTELRLRSQGEESDYVAITDSNGPVLSEMLKTNRTLKVLRLADDIGVSDTGAFHIAEGLKYNTGLEELDLTSCDITSQGAEFLADALVVNKKLRALYLSQNFFGNSGVTHIANALKVNSTLKELRLACCCCMGQREDEEDEEDGEDGEDEVLIYEVLVDGAETLASALTVNQQLELLDLSETPLDDSGVSYISNALKTNTSLKQLDLKDCEISEKGAETLASVLAVNTTLENLNLERTPR